LEWVGTKDINAGWIDCESSFPALYDYPIRLRC
jgi:hypothetical protein